MKKSNLLIYYSRTKITKQLALQIKKQLNCDIEEIQDKRGNLLGPLNYIKCGKEALAKNTPEILQPQSDPKNYKRIIIGSPVWAGRVASPIQTYLQTILKPNKIDEFDIFLTQTVSGALDAIKELKKEFLIKNVLILNSKQIKNNTFEKSRIKDFTKAK